jgi:hypothetical protein
VVNYHSSLKDGRLWVRWWLIDRLWRARERLEFASLPLQEPDINARSVSKRLYRISEFTPTMGNRVRSCQGAVIGAVKERRGACNLDKWLEVQPLVAINLDDWLTLPLFSLTTTNHGHE